jgi:hypothetical protein
MIGTQHMHPTPMQVMSAAAPSSRTLDMTSSFTFSGSSDPARRLTSWRPILSLAGRLGQLNAAILRPAPIRNLPNQNVRLDRVLCIDRESVTPGHVCVCTHHSHGLVLLLFRTERSGLENVRVQPVELVDSINGVANILRNNLQDTVAVDVTKFPQDRELRLATLRCQFR